MAKAKQRVPAVEGWFQMGDGAGDGPPRLIGSRCRACGSYFFPRETTRCRNPACASGELDEVPLSGRGRLWSFTNNCYPPPPPYVSAEPFEPYAIAAVELADEKMVVLGQVAHDVGVESLKAGMEMELVLGTLYEDAEHTYVVWKWRPAGA